MLVKELHIAIDFYLQEINSNVYGNVLSEEKDFILNWATSEYIDTLISKDKTLDKTGLQANIKNFNSIQELITSTVLPLYIEDSLIQKANVPYNFRDYINTEVNVINNCNNIALTTEAANYHKLVWELKTTDETTEFYKNLVVKIGGGVVFSSVTYFPNGLSSEEEFFRLYHLLYEKLNELSEVDITVFYGKTGDIKDRTLILISPDEIFLEVQYKAAPGALDQEITSTLIENTKYVTTAFTAKKYDTRLVKTEDKAFLLNHPFGKSIYNSPIIEWEQDILYLHHSESFIGKEITLKYIRKPKRIDISLNQGLELSDPVCKVIARKAAEQLSLIKGASTVNNIIKLNQFLT